LTAPGTIEKKPRPEAVPAQLMLKKQSGQPSQIIYYDWILLFHLCVRPYERRDMGNRRTVVAAAILVAAFFTAVLVELCAYVIIEVGGINFYLPLKLSEPVNSFEAEELGVNFSYELGWEPTATSAHGYRGSDRSIERAALAVFGDSFTFAHPDIEKSWPELLGSKLGHPVLNFGVRGYGPDQSYLRFRKRYFGQLETPYVALLILSENIARTVNRYRGFYLRRSSLSATKPRYMVDSNSQIVFLANPVRSPEEMIQLWDADFRNRIGQDDYWYRFFEHRGLNDTVGFPYSYHLINSLPFLVETAHRQWVENYTIYEDLYRVPEATAVMTFIIESFVADGRATGAVPIVVFLPTWKDLVDYLRGGKTIYSDYLVTIAEQSGTDVADGLQYFKPLLDRGAEVSTFFISRQDRHYNPRGERVIADGMFSLLEEFEQRERRLQ
jgi:hypothetical protein